MTPGLKSFRCALLLIIIILKMKKNDRRSERNLCDCVKKPEKNSGHLYAIA